MKYVVHKRLLIKLGEKCANSIEGSLPLPNYRESLCLASKKSIYITTRAALRQDNWRCPSDVGLVVGTFRNFHRPENSVGGADPLIV